MNIRRLVVKVGEFANNFFYAPFTRSGRDLTVFLLGSIWLAGFGHWATAATANANMVSRIDELVACYERCGFLNGAVLVADHGKIIYCKGVGDAEFQTHKPNTPDTRFGIASITKQFTAVLVLKAVAKGELQLQGTVSDYLPWYRKDTGKQMTLEQLLHHTSGLPADFDTPEFSDGPEASRSYDVQEFARKFCQHDLVAKPGTRWAYSNCGYVLLGLILEQATGRSFEDLLTDQILVPAGMKNTGLVRHDLSQIEGAFGYTRHAGPRYTPGRDLDLGHIFSAGAMYSTTRDLLLWNQALSDGKLLPSDLQEQVFKAGLGNWGYGWFITKIPAGAPGAGSTLQEMRGDMPGNFFAWTIRYPDQDRVVIVLRNGYGSTEHFEDKLQAILFGQEPRLPGRNPKDVLAHAGFVTYGLLDSHPTVGLLLLALSFLVAWQFSRHRLPLQRTACPGCCNLPTN